MYMDRTRPQELYSIASFQRIETAAIFACQAFLAKTIPTDHCIISFIIHGLRMNPRNWDEKRKMIHALGEEEKTGKQKNGESGRAGVLTNIYSVKYISKCSKR